MAAVLLGAIIGGWVGAQIKEPKLYGVAQTASGWELRRLPRTDESQGWEPGLGGALAT